MKHGRTDTNQIDIVKSLRASGCSVRILSDVGGGFPDILVGRNGVNVLMEIKDGSLPLSKQKLTPDEVEFHDRWKGQAAIVRDIDEAIAVVNEIVRGGRNE